MKSIALQNPRKVNPTISIEQSQSLSLDRTEEAEVEMVSEDLIVKTSKHGSSVRTTVSITSRQDVLTTGVMLSNDPTTTDNGGSLRNRDRKVSKTVKSTVVEEKKEIKKKTSMMEFHNIKISQVRSCSMTVLLFVEIHYCSSHIDMSCCSRHLVLVFPQQNPALQTLINLFN